MKKKLRVCLVASILAIASSVAASPRAEAYHPVLIGFSIAGGYIQVIDASIKFGEWLGPKIYEATH